MTNLGVDQKKKDAVIGSILLLYFLASVVGCSTVTPVANREISRSCIDSAKYMSKYDYEKGMSFISKRVAVYNYGMIGFVNSEYENQEVFLSTLRGTLYYYSDKNNNNALEAVLRTNCEICQLCSCERGGYNEDIPEIIVHPSKDDEVTLDEVVRKTDTEEENKYHVLSAKCDKEGMPISLIRNDFDRDKGREVLEIIPRKADFYAFIVMDSINETVAMKHIKPLL